VGFFVGVVGFEVCGESGQGGAEVFSMGRVGDEPVEGGGQFLVQGSNCCVLLGEAVQRGLEFGEGGGEAGEDAVLA
jgi:hypothetical protein